MQCGTARLRSTDGPFGTNTLVMNSTDRQSRLRANLSAESKRLLDTIDEMHELEELKRAEPISTPAFHRLADEVLAKGKEVFRITSEQEAMGDAIDTGAVSLNDVNPNDSHDRGTNDHVTAK